MKQSSYSLKPKPMRYSQEYTDWHDAATKGRDTTALGVKHSRKMLGKQYDENMARLKRLQRRAA